MKKNLKKMKKIIKNQLKIVVKMEVLSKFKENLVKMMIFPLTNYNF